MRYSTAFAATICRLSETAGKQSEFMGLKRMQALKLRKEAYTRCRGGEVIKSAGLYSEEMTPENHILKVM